jgi:thioredoxin reductase
VFSLHSEFMSSDSTVVNRPLGNDREAFHPANVWDAIVVGGGAAGLSAALMLGRARRSVLVIDGGEPRNRFAAHMHGVLGHDGRDPLDLLAKGRAEVAGYGGQVVSGTVAGVVEADDLLVVETVAGHRVRSRTLVAATGIRDRLPDIPGLAERWGRSVLHCPYCHGWEVRGRRFGVLATSAFSLHQAQLVRQWSDRVTYFDNGLGLLDADTRARLESRDIAIVLPAAVEVIGDGDAVTGVRTEDGRITAVDAIFTGGVLEPQDGYLGALALPRTDGPVGSFLTVDPAGRTGHPRVWAVGNLVNPQATVPVAISSGAMAGAQINFALVSKEFDAAARSSAAVA